MDYALILLLPILGGLLLGNWLSQRFGLSPIWSLALAILGMFAGIGIMYKRYAYPELYGGQKPPGLFKKRPKQPPPGPPANEPERKIYYDLSDIRLDDDEDGDDSDLDEFDREDDPR